MKNIVLSIFFLLGIAGAAIGQTATGVVTQTPCNNDGIYTITTTGIPLPITYTYYVNGTTVVHANVNSATDQLTNFGMSPDGYLYCQAVGGGLYAITQNSYTPSFVFDINVTSPTCPATMGTINAVQASGTTGPFTYTWTNAQTMTPYTGNNITVPVGTYDGDILDQTTGCVLHIEDTNIVVMQLSNVTASINTTPASCTNGTAAAVASGGIAPYSYLWGNGATTSSITGLSQGYYPVTITDAQGCHSNYLGASVLQNPVITVNKTITNATCLQPNGSAIAFGSGGVNPYTYSWSNGQTGSTATNLPGGAFYQVIATDANGCTGETFVFVGTSTPITVTYTSTPSQCTSATGSATLSPTGGTAPYTYFWVSNPSVTGPTISNVAPGTYAFQVTDAVGCIRNGAVVVAPVSVIDASINASTVICPATTGTAVAVVSGTNAPFSYLWSNAATTSSISGVPLGTYTCTITDALGCSVTKSKTLSAISPVSLGVATVNATCIYNTDGSANAIASGGTAPYSYSYSNGTTTPNATGLGVDDYSVTVTDMNGCNSSAHFWINNANTSQSCY